MIIAITGYIGVGKTTAANFFEELGYEIINADKIGHELLLNESVKDSIVSEFGMDILDRKLQVDREKLGKIVFNDDEKLKILDSIIHPKLESELKRIIMEKKGKNLVIDIALLIELGIKELCDKIILIKADTLNVYERLNERYHKQEILKIMNGQNILSDAEIIIENNGTKEDLKNKIREAVSNL